MASPEHQAIAETIDEVLQSLAGSALIGVYEGQRRTFDYSCLLKRDLGRPLVAQVLWQHEHGIDKDLRTLLLDKDSLIKVYAIRDSARIRATVDDILVSYRNDPQLNGRLRGLKLIFVPPDFDADHESQRRWLRGFLISSFSQDVAFAILFGGLTKRVFEVFMGHNGPFGLKYAILDEVVNNGLTHMPSFKDHLGYKSSGPIREALTMLNATGLVQNWATSNCYFPTIRGRFILDFTRRLLLDVNLGTGWSEHTRGIFETLQVPTPFYPEAGISSANLRIADSFSTNLLHATACEKDFGRDLLKGVESENPKLYSEFDIERFADQMQLAKGFRRDFFDQPEYLFFPNLGQS